MVRRVFAAAGVAALLMGVVLLAPPARLSAGQDAPVRALTPAAQVLHAPVNEMSGIVRSRRYPGVFWVHNDSGDEPRLFAVRADGTVVMPGWLSGEYYVGPAPVVGKKEFPGVRLDAASNFDWEDIALDGDTLYVADVGNNGNARRDMGVYVLTEPNPEEVDRARVLKWLPVAYEDQKAFPPPQDRRHFDCEAVFVYRGKLYLVTKHRTAEGGPAPSANLYRIDTTHTDRVKILRRVDSHSDLGGWVTAADLSPDGKTLAVLCQWPVQSVWLFEAAGGGGGDRFLSGRARRLVFTDAKQCEAVCFDGDSDLLVTNEQRDIFRLAVRDFPPIAR